MKRLYGFLFTWGAIIYGIGFVVSLFGGWWTTGAFDISLLVLAVCWPAILLILLLGFLFRLMHR